MFPFNKRKRKKRFQRRADSVRPGHPPPDVEHPAESSGSESPRSEHGDGSQSSRNYGKRSKAAGGAVAIAALAQQIVSHLIPHLVRRDHDIVDQCAERSLESRTGIVEHIDALAGKVAETLNQQFDQQGRTLGELVESQIQPLGDRIVAAAAENADKCGNALRIDLMDACSTVSQRAVQRPIVDGLIVLLDRICDERDFLVAWYRKDPQLALHLGCRQLHERYDGAVGSFGTEIRMILRSLGVEQIAGCSGPFNPQRQKVVASETTTNPELDGHVARIVRAGFLWNGTILRPEQVVVFKMERKNYECQEK